MRKTAYKTSASRLLARLNGIHQNLGELKGKEPVKIYKKKSNKKANSKD